MSDLTKRNNQPSDGSVSETNLFRLSGPINTLIKAPSSPPEARVAESRVSDAVTSGSKAEDWLGLAGHRRRLSRSVWLRVCAERLSRISKLRDERAEGDASSACEALTRQ